MSDRDAMGDSDLDDRLRREGEAWRSLRSGCPDPDLLLARRSEAIDPEVRARLEAHLASCEPCARLGRDLEDTLSAESRDAESRVLARLRPQRPMRLAPWMGLAAGIVMVAGLASIWWSRSSPAPTAVPQTSTAAGVPTAAPFTQVEPPPVVALWVIEPAAVRVPLSALGTSRSAEGTGEKNAAALIQALSPYQQGDFATAASRLEELVQQDARQADAYFYLGVCYLMIDRPASAVGALEKGRTVAHADRHAEIDWYLATAEQRSGQTEASRTRLRALCAAAGRFKGSACAALAALE
jgi:hypothetical protein